ncbi:MAG: hypothetical protein JNN05_03435, partial [Candidatus Omnitrophica bacterium]|nr:hypothetical protein [Candidatus Omnitrophota bacterium]
EKATAIVIANIRISLMQDLVTRFPDMPEAQRNSVVEEKFAQTLHNESGMVKKAILEVSKKLNTQTPQAKRMYLQEADGYYYYDLTQNIVETGRLSGDRKASKFLNERMNAPFGFWQPINLHPYVGFYLYQFLKLFYPDISVINALCYTGPLLSLLALGAFILCCRALAVGPLAAGIGSIYFYLAPIFVKRSTFAWNDDDSYNVIFPLLILALVFKGLKHVKTSQESLIYGISTAALMCVYSLFWHGWGFTFAIICVSALFILALQFYFIKSAPTVKPKAVAIQLPDLKLISMFLITIFVGTPVLMSLMFGPGDFITLLEEGFSGLQKLTVNQISVWPNLFVAVGELKRAPLSEIIEMTGNLFWWIISIGGSLWAFGAHIMRKDRIKTSQLIVIFIALAATLKITFSAERFILLCLMPVSLLGVTGLDQLINTFRKSIHRQTLLPGKLKPVEIASGLLLLITTTVVPIRSINAQIPQLLSPIFNSTWEKALLDIKNNTPAQSIITSWWPPGHFIKAVARRRVTFDGATITSNEQAYWVANILLASNEEKAARILRMLNTSGTKPLDFLIDQGMKTSDAVSLLHFLLEKNKNDALEFLSKIMPKDNAKKIVDMTHAEAIASYLLIYSELMEKNIGLQFVGKWNFRQMEEINSRPEEIKSLPPANSPEFFEFLWKTMGGPYRYSEALITIGESGSIVNFTEGVKVDLNTKDVTIASSKFGVGTPLSIVYLDNGAVVEKILRNPTLKYSVVFFKENSKYYCRLMDQELAQSLLTRMYFFKGQGLKYFKPFSIQSSMTGKDEVFVFELQEQNL